jgi:hypothetical protein
MKSLILVLAVLGSCLVGCECDAQIFRRPVGINWNAECAMQAATGFAACKQAGGRTWPCAIQAGLDYWNCSGSNFQTGFRSVNRVRAGLTGLRVRRAK